MVEIRWSPKSADDFDNIISFIALNSEIYAKIFATNMMQFIEDIPRFPFAGRIVPEYKIPTLRERIYRNYRIVYRILGNDVELVTITHGFRLLKI